MRTRRIGMTVDVITADMREVLPTLAADSFDCIFTDPPYGETSLSWDRWPVGWPALCRRVLKPSGSMWVFGSMRMFMERAAEFAGWRMSQDVVWEKHNGAGFANDRFRRVHEMAVHFYRDDAAWADVFLASQFTQDATARVIRHKERPAHWKGARGANNYETQDGGPRLMRSVIYARSSHGHAVHPTQKPVSIVSPLLAYACPVGGSVLDCFAGSGTTGLVASQLGINATLIEAREDYATIARSCVVGGPLFVQEAACATS